LGIREVPELRVVGMEDARHKTQRVAVLERDKKSVRPKMNDASTSKPRRRPGFGAVGSGGVRVRAIAYS
jgi:hypothetical protein